MKLQNLQKRHIVFRGGVGARKQLQTGGGGGFQGPEAALPNTAHTPFDDRRIRSTYRSMVAWSSSASALSFPSSMEVSLPSLSARIASACSCERP